MPIATTVTMPVAYAPVRHWNAGYTERVRRITRCSILLAEKGGTEDTTSGSPTPPGRESARGK